MTLEMRHHYLPVHGVLLHWVELGEPSEQPPIVMLHGLNDCYLSWKDVGEALATDRHVLLLDLPGHGLSDRPNASYRLQWYTQLVAAWLAALDLEQIDLVGHSFGGGVAQTLLLECSERIHRMVLVAAGGLGRDVSMALRLAAMPYVIEKFGQPFMRHGVQWVLRGSHASANHIAELGVMNTQRGTARAFSRTVRDLIGWRGQRQGFLQRAHEIKTLPPMAIFWGGRDNIIPASHGQAIAERVEGVALTSFADCGHYPHHQEPTKFLTALRGFLDAPWQPSARLRPAVKPQRRFAFSVSAKANA